MAKDTIKTVNDLFTDERIWEARNIFQEQATKNAQENLEKLMFPEEKIYDTKVSMATLTKNIAPTPYATVEEIPKVNNLGQTIVDQSWSLPPKKEAQTIDMYEFSSAIPKSASGELLAQAMSKRNDVIFGMEQNLDARNRVEVWKYLTLGMLSSKGGDKELPFYGVDRTNYATYKVVYNWIPGTPWFAAGGTVNAAADIMGDLSTAINYMYANNYSNPRSIWMNSTTYAALLGNTKMQADYGSPSYWENIKVADFLGMATTRLPKGLRASSFRADTDVGIFIYDGYQTYQQENHTTTTYKFLPDYYVLVMPENPGVRKSGLTYMTNQPGRAMKSIITKPDHAFFENITMLPEERSYPFPTAGVVDELGTWRSHLILYVRALT